MSGCSVPASSCKHSARTGDSDSVAAAARATSCKKKPRTLDFSTDNQFKFLVDNNDSKSAKEDSIIKNESIEEFVIKMPGGSDQCHEATSSQLAGDVRVMSIDDKSGHHPSHCAVRDAVPESPGEGRPTAHTVMPSRLNSVYSSVTGSSDSHTNSFNITKISVPSKVTLSPEVSLFLRLLLGWLFDLPIFPDGLFYTDPSQTDINMEVRI